jgi:hypothetical protein
MHTSRARGLWMSPVALALVTIILSSALPTPVTSSRHFVPAELSGSRSPNLYAIKSECGLISGEVNITGIAHQTGLYISLSLFLSLVHHCSCHLPHHPDAIMLLLQGTCKTRCSKQRAFVNRLLRSLRRIPTTRGPFWSATTVTPSSKGGYVSNSSSCSGVKKKTKRGEIGWHTRSTTRECHR